MTSVSTKISRSLNNVLWFTGVVLIAPVLVAAGALNGFRIKKRNSNPEPPVEARPDSKKAALEKSQINTASRKSRLAMITEAAYYRAEKRGFQSGNPVEDWLAAEKEIDEKLAKEKTG